MRIIDPGPDTVGDPVSDCAGLSRSGTGQNAQWTGERGGCRTLLIIEPLQYCFRAARLCISHDLYGTAEFGDGPKACG